MEKFRQAKVGDTVYDLIYGKGIIVGIRENNTYPILVEFNNFGRVGYTYKGQYLTEDNKPRLYWNEVKLPSDEEDKKPFDLTEYLKRNLTPKDFVFGERNFYLRYEGESGVGEWGYGDLSYLDNLAQFFDDPSDEVLEKLNEKKITVKEVIKSFRELGWK